MLNSETNWNVLFERIKNIQIELRCIEAPRKTDTEEPRNGSRSFQIFVRYMCIISNILFLYHCSGSDRPDIKQVAVLSFATLVHQTRLENRIDETVFEKYVKKYFELFMSKYEFKIWEKKI